MKKLLIFAVIALVFLLPAQAFDYDNYTWANYSFNARNCWQINKSSTDSDLIIWNNISHSDISSSENDFADVVFYQQNLTDENKLTFFLENYTSSEWALFHLKTGRLDNGGDEYICAYYDNDGIASTESNSTPYNLMNPWWDDCWNNNNWEEPVGSIWFISGYCQFSGSDVGYYQGTGANTSVGYVWWARAKADEQDTKFLIVGDRFALDPYNGAEVMSNDGIDNNDFDSLYVQVWNSTPGAGSKSFTQNTEDVVPDWRNNYYHWKIYMDDQRIEWWTGDRNFLNDTDSTDISVDETDLMVGFGVWSTSTASTLSLDYVGFGKWSSEVVFGTFEGQDYQTANTTSLNVSSPINGTDYFSNPNIVFDTDDPFYSTIHVKYWLDTVLIYENASFPNATTFTNSTTNFDYGEHNLTVWVNASSETTETVIFTIEKYSAGTPTGTAEVIEGETSYYSFNVRINPDIVYDVDAGMFFNGTYNGTATETSNATHWIFTHSVFMPIVSPYNQTMTYFFNYSVTLSNSTVEYANSSTGNQTLYRMTLTNCSFFNTTTISFFLYNESDDTPVSGDLEIANDVTYGVVERNYSFEWSGITAANMCIYPGWATYDVVSQIEYSATGFSTRVYFIASEISNVTQTVNLYLLNESDGEQVIIYVKDPSGIAQEDVIVKIQRFYVGTYSYKTVAQILTDYDGKGSTYLDVDDVYYKFILEQNSTTLREFSPALIVCAPGSSCPPYTVTLYTSEEEQTEYSQIFGRISYNCWWNNNTGVLSCTGSDTTGLSQSFRLVVEQLGILTDTTVCSSSDSSSAVTITCTLTNWTGYTYHYEFSVDLPETGWVVLTSDFLDFYTVSYSYGWIGTLAAFLMILMAYFMAENPAMAIILPTVAIIALAVMGLIPIEFSLLMELGVLAAVAVYKMRV